MRVSFLKYMLDIFNFINLTEAQPISLKISLMISYRLSTGSPGPLVYVKLFNTISTKYGQSNFILARLNDPILQSLYSKFCKYAIFFFPLVVTVYRNC